MKKILLIFSLSLSYAVKINKQENNNDFILAKFTPIQQSISFMADNISESMKGYKACILKNHGLLAADETLEKAYHVMMEVENLARLYIGVRGIGDYSVLPDSEMEVVLEKFKNYGLNVKHKNKK